jgi:hypothetical protein
MTLRTVVDWCMSVCQTAWYCNPGCITVNCNLNKLLDHSCNLKNSGNETKKKKKMMMIII